MDIAHTLKRLDSFCGITEPARYSNAKYFISNMLPESDRAEARALLEKARTATHWSEEKSAFEELVSFIRTSLAAYLASVA